MQRQLKLGIKRIIDLILSFLSLAILALPFLFIAILIKLDSKGPVFFRQERAGKNGRIYKVWKFRTMITGAVNIGLGYNVAKEDSRITKIGKILRNLGLDELPQFINVLIGKMSIVGPRPTIPYQIAYYNEFQKQRLLMKPGITGYAIVKGRNLLTWQERIEYDVWYIEHWSIFLDLWIMLKTIWVVLIKREGVYSETGINYDFKEPTNNTNYREHKKQA